MLREPRFVQCHRPYAVNLATLTGSQHPLGQTDFYAFSGVVHAVWYRRQNGTTRACVGTLKLWSHSLKTPLDLDDPRGVLSADLDGRYGGDCRSRWDGARFWSAVQDPGAQAADLALLGPMLENHPQPAPGYDGWWHF
jgi:hypothetical protein